MARRNPSLKTAFSPAIEASNLSQKIQALQAEVSQLKVANQDLSSLAEKLKSEFGEQMLDINKMRPSKQCRQTFTEQEIREKANSLLTYGQLQPLVLIPLEKEGEFAIEEGELRWKAAHLLVQEGHSQWQYLRSVFNPQTTDEVEIYLKTLLHHALYHPLNPLDKVESFCQYVKLAIAPNQSDQEIKSRIQALDYYFRKHPELRKKFDTLLLQQGVSLQSELNVTAEQAQLLEIIAKTQIKLESLARDRLNLLDLPKDLKQAVRQQGLNCKAATLIAKINSKKLPITEVQAQKERQELVRRVLSEKLSAREINQLIKARLPQKSTSSLSIKELQTNLAKLSLENASDAELANFKNSLTDVIHQINQLLTTR